MFNDQIRRNVAVYVDDMLIKSQKASQHEERLEEIFRVIRDKRLMLNPTKCTFGVKKGNSWGILSQRKE